MHCDGDHRNEKITHFLSILSIWMLGQGKDNGGTGQLPYKLTKSCFVINEYFENITFL
jgi:hypothetical protein